jgi:hypothetical protein
LSAKFLKSKTRSLIFGLASLGLIAIGIYLTFGRRRIDFGSAFNGERALQDASYQMSLGPRVADSEAHAQAVAWIADILRQAGWDVEIQNTEMLGHPIQNVIAKRGAGQPWIILGAHYDSRLRADQDPDPAARQLPVPGANDGASGVAVLLELARVLPQDSDGQIWLVFFDAEDNGSIEGWDWILGSRAFADSLLTEPDGVIVVDMIGDADLNIYREANSDAALVDQIWQQAAELGHDDVFIDSVKYSMLDDHSPFLGRGIPAVDIIDFDYAYWHTRADTLDKISASSLQAVGETLLAWLLAQ